jgi:RNA polymerase sigma-70 factor, ECF subfamily
MSAPNEADFGDDSELVRLLLQASQGDKAALEQLFRRLYPYLLLCAREELDSDLRAQVRESDLVQQSCLEAHRDFPRFHGNDVATLVKWLEAILRSNAADLRRRFEARQRKGVGPDISLDDSQSSLAQELRQNLLDSGGGVDMTGSNATDLELEMALAKLPEDYREVILLRHRDKLSFAEIGSKTGRSADAVRMCWTRAVKRLQSNLDGEEQSEE